MAERGKRFSPSLGVVYRNRGGGEYICVNNAWNKPYDAVMENVKSGWRATMHGVLLYADGTIEWDYSTGGHWTR